MLQTIDREEERIRQQFGERSQTTAVLLCAWERMRAAVEGRQDEKGEFDYEEVSV